MYISLLNPMQQDSLSQIVQFVAQVDGHDDHRESMLGASLLEESHLEHIPAAAQSLAEVRALLPGFSDTLAKRVLLIECLGVALADQVAHPDEVATINEIAKELNVSEEWVAQARDFVQRTIELQREGRDLLSAD